MARKRSKTIPARATTRVPLLRILVIWGLYFFALTGVFLWLRADNEQILALYQQSPWCDHQAGTQKQENCRESLAATVNQIDIIYGVQSQNRYGGGSRSNEPVSIDLDLALADGSTARSRIDKEIDYQKQEDKALNNNTWLFLNSIDWIQKGDKLTVTRWHGKVISVAMPQSPEVLTLDHPANFAKIRYPTAGAIFGLLFIVLLIYTGSDIIRKRK
jgi:hypothetical protein